MSIPDLQNPSRAAQLPWWRRLLSALGTAAAVVVVGFFGIAFAVLPINFSSASSVTLWHTLGFLAALPCAIVLIWRRSAPIAVFLLTSALTVLLPLSPLAPAVALPWVLARGSRNTWIWAIVLATVTISLPLWRDWHYGVNGSIWVTEPGDVALDGPTYLIGGIAILLVSIAVGGARRWAGLAAGAQLAANQVSAEAVQLRGELSRQDERELIAREMHDTVANHLSLASLHAGVLEVTSTDEQVLANARAIREQAHRATDEMRVLISSLRDSTQDGYQGGIPTFADLRALVEQTRQTGVKVNAEIAAPGLSELPPALARATYRIVQESLTNALKHARGSGIGVLVAVQPEVRADIAVSNWIVPRAPTVYADPNWKDWTPPGTGTGLLGMRERAESLGGGLSAAANNNRWEVRAWLPWTRA
ncbi:histidine kinase [Actinomyces sp. F1_1611]